MIRPGAFSSHRRVPVSFCPAMPSGSEATTKISWVVPTTTGHVTREAKPLQSVLSSPSKPLRGTLCDQGHAGVPFWKSLDPAWAAGNVESGSRFRVTPASPAAESNTSSHVRIAAEVTRCR